MKPRNLTAVGALHPILFFATVYIVALLLSVFICTSIFKSLNSSTASQYNKESQPNTVAVSTKNIPTATIGAVVALR